MRLYYYRDSVGNFGDELNLPLWTRLLPQIIDGSPDHLFVGIGTLLNKTLPAANRYTVFGSGAGYGEPPLIDERWLFACVRGPLTARALDLPPEAVVTDPALLVRELVPIAARSARGAALFIPHHISAARADWRGVCRAAGLAYVDPSDPPLQVARRIAKARFVVTEAMHGAILADALRTPWHAVVTGGHINREKWSDWLLTVGLEPAFDEVPPLRSSPTSSPVRWARLTWRQSLRAGRPSIYRGSSLVQPLSDAAAIANATEALADVVARASIAARHSDDAIADRLERELRARVAMVRGR